jgi:membrane protein DedA with SNARE-associated domain
MNLEPFISAYGYPALGIGTLLEGGMVGMVAGGLAHRGYLQLPWVICIIFGCAFGADQFFFQVGKRNGRNLLARRPKWEPQVERVRRFLVRYNIIAVLSFRFLYGMRTITPIVIGASGFDTRRFVFLNLCSTLLWATVVGCSGYYFSHVLETLFSDVRHHIVAILFAGLAIGAGIWLCRRWLKER